jgi:hypothetical protein
MTEAVAEWTPEEWLAHHRPLGVGTRVRLRTEPIAVTLHGVTGTIQAPDPDLEGYYLVRLDTPGVYHRADGATEPLPIIREAWDNLDPLDDAESRDA